MICRTRACSGPRARPSLWEQFLPPPPALLSSFPAAGRSRTVVAGREGVERGGDGGWGVGRGGEGGWARCYSLSLPPGNTALGRRLEEERLAEKPEAEGQGPWGAEKEGGAAPGSREGKGLKACLLDPQRRRGLQAWDFGSSLPPLLHFPTDNTYSFILSTNRHLSSPAGARHCAGLLGQEGKDGDERSSK